ncbi:hypothetical protein [Stenotrophomonas sp. PD6]|uniref:hypothetical protein n=1 Tax=Stenotrophomonas sp. PD6 TaxID=3368612 RepID=UPI003BA05794
MLKRWRSLRSALCAAAMAAWLGWLVPLACSQWTSSEASLSAAQILARLGPLPAADGAPVLLRIGAPCACTETIPAELPAMPARDYHSIATVVPYPWVVLDAKRRLVYAGPALLIGSGRPQSAAPLVQRLLAQPQAPMILSPHCACTQD